MGWSVVQCPKFVCSRYMITQTTTKRKKCPYCGRSFKVVDNHIRAFRTQDQARVAVQKLNNKL